MLSRSYDGIDLAGIERRRGTFGIAEGTSDILKLTRWAEARARRAEPRGDVAGIVQAVEEQVILDDRPGQLSDHLAPLVLIVIIVREQRVGRLRFERFRLPVELSAAVDLVRAHIAGRFDAR